MSARIRQWEIWKHPAQGRDHWYVIFSGQERLDSRHDQINGLLCVTQHGPLLKTDVMLNSAEGFQFETACQCDLIYPLQKSKLHVKIGMVSEFRREALKRKIVEVHRLIP